MHQLANPEHFIVHELCYPAPDGPLLWRLRFNASVLDAHLQDVGQWGIAYRLYLNSRFIYSERFPSEEAARQAAAEALTQRVADGWTLETRRRTA